ncbi:MAG: formate--tetrahydrofolate ligase, partial [Burkholderiales bacterium]
MRSDIEIAQAATLQRVSELAQNQLGISDDHLYAYGHHKAKLSLKYIEKLPA